jgi:outer membrane protein assembly factor BamB
MKKGLLLALVFLSMIILAGCNDQGPDYLTTPPPKAPLSLYLIYTPAGPLELAQSTISALDASTGKERWNYVIKRQTQGFLVLSQNVLYFGASDGYVYAFNAFDGQMRWRTQLVTDGLPEVEGASNGLVYAILAIDQSNPYNGGSVIALRVKDGTVKWQSPVQGNLDGVTSNALYVSSQQTFYALNPTTGQQLWQFNTDNPPGLGQVLDGQVYIGARAPFDPNNPNTSRPGVFYDLNASNGTLKWRYPGQDAAQQPANLVGFANGTVYLTNSDQPNPSTQDELLALNASDGSLKWRFRHSGLDSDGYNVAVQDSIVYIGGDDGSLYALSEQDGSLLWQSKPTSGPFALSLGADGGVYISSFSENNILALSTKDGSTRWKYDKIDTSSEIIQMANGVLYGETFTAPNSLSPYPSSVFALRPTSGATLWAHDVGSGQFYVMVG